MGIWMVVGRLVDSSWVDVGGWRYIVGSVCGWM